MGQGLSGMDYPESVQTFQGKYIFYVWFVVGCLGICAI